jgi:hypothetical protein
MKRNATTPRHIGSGTACPRLPRACVISELGTQSIHPPIHTSNHPAAGLSTHPFTIGSRRAQINPHPVLLVVPAEVTRQKPLDFGPRSLVLTCVPGEVMTQTDLPFNNPVVQESTDPTLPRALLVLLFKIRFVPIQPSCFCLHPYDTSTPDGCRTAHFIKEAPNFFGKRGQFSGQPSFRPMISMGVRVQC